MGNSWIFTGNHGSQDVQVQSANPNTNYFGVWGTAVGASAILDLWRIFVQMPIVTRNLPPGAVITNAAIIIEFGHEIAPIAYNVYMHEVLAPWDAGTITWNTMPAINPVPEDAVPIIDPGIPGTVFSWDITALVQAWYAGTKVNSGVCFIGEELIASSYKMFYANARIYITYTAFTDLSDLDAFFYICETEPFGLIWIYKIRKDNGSITGGWGINISQWVNKIAVDNTGHVYIAAWHWPFAPFTLYKYGPDSNLLWAMYDIQYIESVAVDLSSRVAAIGMPTGGFTTWVYDSTSALEWAADHGDWPSSVAFDSHNRVYTGGWPAPVIGYRKYEADGTPVWTLLDDNGYYITVDLNDYVYIQNSPWGASVSKLQPDSTLVWTVQHGSWINELAVDDVGRVFIMGDEAVGDEGGPADGMSFRKLDTDGTILWSVAADRIFGGAPDPNSDVYLTIQKDGGIEHIVKLDSTGALVWDSEAGFSDNPAEPLTWPYYVAVAPGLAGAGFWPAVVPYAKTFPHRTPYYRPYSHHRD